MPTSKKSEQRVAFVDIYPDRGHRDLIKKHADEFLSSYLEDEDPVPNVKELCQHYYSALAEFDARYNKLVESKPSTTRPLSDFIYTHIKNRLKSL